MKFRLKLFNLDQILVSEQESELESLDEGDMLIPHDYKNQHTEYASDSDGRYAKFTFGRAGCAWIVKLVNK